MGALLLGTELLSCFLLTIWLLNKYANWRKLSPIVSGSVFIAWYFSFIIIFVLPLDVSITYFNRCKHQKVNSTENCEKPEGYVPDAILLRLWQIVYWSAQVLCWLILPLLQSYCAAGDFTAMARFKSAVMNNIIYYGIYLTIFILILFYAMISGVAINNEHLKVILVSASNTWGLFLLVVLLGYGLVELPRSLWHTGSRNYRLKKTYFDLEKLSGEKNDAEDTVKQLYRESRRILNTYKNNEKLHNLAQEVISKFPQEIVEEVFPARNATEFSGTADNKYIHNPKKYLVAHHKYVIEAVQAYKRSSARWKHLMERALFLEIVSQAELTGRMNATIKEDNSSISYYWHIVFKRPVLKIIAVLMTFMTVLILLSECTFFITHPTLSPAALIMDYTAERFRYKYTEFVAIGIIFYLCWCAYFTIFRLKIYKYYHLDPHKNTDENSLLFSAMLICRLTPPICLNFLGMVHLDSHITQAKDLGAETQFTRLMGHLDVLPILAKGINIYLPICILILCAINYYRLGTYLLHTIGFDQFIAQDEFTQDMIEAGKSLVQLERNCINRKLNRESRQGAWGERARVRHTVTEGRYSDIAQEDEEIGLLIDDCSRIDSQRQERSPFRENHPTPANIFDDM